MENINIFDSDKELNRVKQYIMQCPVEISQHEKVFTISVPVHYPTPIAFWNVLNRYNDGKLKFFALDWDDGDNLCEWYDMPHVKEE